MTTTRIYDIEIEAFARTIPIVDSSTIQNTRDSVNAYKLHMESKGFTRPTDPSVEEIETKIPGPPNAPDISISREPADGYDLHCNKRLSL